MPTKQTLRHWIRTIILPFVVYGLLLIIYFLLMLRYLDDPLTNLFGSSLALYAISALLLILAQGLLLDVISTFLIKLLGLDQLD